MPAQSQVKRAERHARKDELHKALPLYYTSWKKNQHNQDIIRQLASLNLKLNDTRKAEQWYRKLYEAGYASNNDVYEYLKVMQSNRKHGQVQKILRQLKESNLNLDAYFPDQHMLDTLLKKRNGIKLHPVTFNSSTTSDIAPVYYSDNRLIFMSNRDRGVMIDRKDNKTLKPYYDLYIIRKSPVGYDFDGNGELFSKQSKTTLNDGPLSFSRDKQEVFFTRNIKEYDENHKRIYRLKLYSAQMVSGELTNITLLPFNEPGYSFAYPCLTDDGATLYFASDMPGGYGAMDIYKIERDENGIWKDVQNLGDNVNTLDNEISPYLTKQNELLFASRGLPGIGGYDLFLYWPDDTLKAKNVGAPINSLKDDFGLIMDGKDGYFVSNRNGDSANDDIYYFYASNALALKENFKPTVNKNENKVVVNNGLGARLEIGDDLGKALNLEPIYFMFNSHALTEESEKELDKVIEVLNKYKSMELDLRAHTDSRGADWYNQKLSERRAQSAINYITKRISSPLRITGRGYGESQLLNNCLNGVQCPEEEHAVNRRVEFIIVNIKQ